MGRGCLAREQQGNSVRGLRRSVSEPRTGTTGGGAPHPEEWLLIEWPKGAAEPAKYWLSNLPAATERNDLVRIAKHRWIVERDYEELKQELGLGHFEGRGWRNFHHHAIAAYRRLRVPPMAEQKPFFSSVRAGKLELPMPKFPRSSSRAAPPVRYERHNPASIATLRIAIARHLLLQLPVCPFCGILSL